MRLGRKYVRYVTPEKLKKVNPKNIKLVEKYFSFKNMNLSDDTKKSYESDFNQWLVFIMEQYDNQYILDMVDDDIDDVVDMIEDYIAFCTNMLGNNERRIQRRMASISSFFLYLRKKRKIKENPMDYLDRPSLKAGEKPQVIQTYLTEKQVKEIREKLKELNDLQLSTFFEVALTTMARIKALNSIKIEQINLEEGIIERVKEKEGYEVDLFPSERGLELIKEWLEYRKENNIDSKFLFISKRNGEWKQVAKETMQMGWTKKIGELIGIPHLHPHDFRHSYASLMYNSGMKLEDVQDLLHHLSPDVTLKHYIKKDTTKIKDNKKKFEI
ncbi:tyrosine-type recombinase/integrase [Caldifermentibacillus hisashii]|uniref:Tyrosine-type recombinase/integrase n=1 Tax=Caldifermentibacillus hisashii TaxID=996558 RepID=A0ABU9K4C3_9BACI